MPKKSMTLWVKYVIANKKACKHCLKTYTFIYFLTHRGSAAEHVLYFKCQRKYYSGSASENTVLVIFCDTC